MVSNSRKQRLPETELKDPKDWYRDAKYVDVYLCDGWWWGINSQLQTVCLGPVKKEEKCES